MNRGGRPARRPPAAWTLGGIVVGLAIVAVAATAVLSGTRTPSGPSSSEVGAVPSAPDARSPAASVAPSTAPAASAAPPTAPAFTLPTVGGATLSTAAERGRVLVLDFIAPGCPSCARLIPALDAVAERLASAGVTVVIVDISGLDDDRALAEAYASFGWTGRMKIAKDVEFTVAQAYGVSALGETYVIDRDGVVRWQGVPSDAATLLNAIGRLTGS